MIEVKALTNVFDNEFKEVDSMSFIVEEGEILRFLRDNGAGRTTTITMLETLLYDRLAVLLP